MSKSNIDLSWLGALLTPAPTAETQALTPDLDPGSEGKFLDPNGTLHGSTIDTNLPYQSPTALQRFYHPEQSNAIDAMNNKFSFTPIQAQNENLTQLGIRAGNIARRPAYMQGIAPASQEAAMGQGDLTQTPAEINNANAQTIYAANGGPALSASGMHNETAAAIEEAKARAIRAGVGNVLGTPRTEALATQSGAQLSDLYNQGRMGVLNSEFGRQLAENKLGQAQATGELGLLPSRLSLEGTQLNTQIPIAEEQRSLLPYTTKTMDAAAIRNLAETERMPIPPRYTDLINPDTGGITLSKDPLGANPFALQFAGINDLTSMTGKPQTFKDASGQTYKLPGNSLITGKPEYPLGAPVARPSVSGPSIGGGSNNVNESIQQDTTGSMSPSISMKDIRIRQIRNELDSLGEGAKNSSNTLLAKRYKELEDELNNLHNPAPSNNRIPVRGGFTMPLSIQ